MFTSQAMTKIELTIPEADVIPVTEALADTGVFHPIQEPGGLSTPSYRAGHWQQLALTYGALERRVVTVMEELEIERGALPTKTPHLIDPDIAQRDIERFEHEAEAPIHELKEAELQLARLERYIEQLTPLLELDIDLSTLRAMRYLRVVLGALPTANLERLHSALEHIPFILATLHAENHLTTVVLCGMQQDAEILNRAARSAYLNPLTPPAEYAGTPAEIVAALQVNVAEAQQHIEENRKSLAYLHGMRANHLRHLLWRLRASRTMAETIAGYDHVKNFHIVSGWVPTTEVAAFKRHIEHAAEHVLIDEPQPTERAEQIPAALHNPAALRAFQGLATNYGQPSYGELDPTPVLALTFPLIFGLMFGDVGHGLLLLAVGVLLLSRKIKALASLSGMGTIVALCGVTSTIFGFLYGSLFGFEHVIPALWVHPLENIMRVVTFTVLLGMGLITLGMVYNILNAALARHWGQFFFGHNGIAGVLFYWSLIGLLAGAFNISIPLPAGLLRTLATLAGVGLTFGEVFTHLVEGHRPLIEGDVGAYVMQSLFELFEVVISMLSNTLSYIRVGAFAVAHGALSLVVFILAEMVGPQHGLFYWMIIVFGNLFVIGFEGMIVGIQTLRLEYYEFFSKFFAGNGLAYQPLSLIRDD